MSNGPFISSWRTDMSPDCERNDPSDDAEATGDVCHCGDFVLAGETHLHQCEMCGADISPEANYCSWECKNSGGAEDAAFDRAEMEADR